MKIRDIVCILKPFAALNKQWAYGMVLCGLVLCSTMDMAQSTLLPATTTPPCHVLAAHDPEQAKAMAAARLANDPADHAALACRANANFFAQDFVAAAGDFTTLATITPEAVGAAAYHNKAGWAWLRAERLKPAATSFAAALKLMPRHGQYWQDHATALMQAEQFWDAVPELDQALRLLPNNATLLGLRAQCWLRVGIISKAKQDAQAALAIQPNETLATAVLQKIALAGE